MEIDHDDHHDDLHHCHNCLLILIIIIMMQDIELDNAIIEEDDELVGEEVKGEMARYADDQNAFDDVHHRDDHDDYCVCAGLSYFLIKFITFS